MVDPKGFIFKNNDREKRKHNKGYDFLNNF